MLPVLVALRFLAGVTMFAAAIGSAFAQSSDCTNADLVYAPSITAHEDEAVRMLREEAQLRTSIAWRSRSLEKLSTASCTIVIGTMDELSPLVPKTLHLPSPPAAAESYAVQSRMHLGHPLIFVVGHDERGVLFGAGALLRKLALSPGHALLEAPLDLNMAPQKPIRSHQLGYRFKNNTYDAWNLAQFEQQIRDLAIFGANAVQVIAPVSDDEAVSPLSPTPPLETLLGISALLDRYGLDCDLYYPEMEPDYSKTESIERELARFEDLVRRMKRLDSLWIPGGDPGHTAPDLLFPLVEREAAILHRYHPHAAVYVSAQGMDAKQYADFYRLLKTQPVWLSGVFFGPQSRDSFESQRERVPASLPIVFYPDIGHTMHAQFPVREWDPAFALTEGREPIDPRPVDEGVIYRSFASLNIGFVSYSEGVNDDVNKMLWSQWGWNANLSAVTILEDYGRLYAGPAFADNFATALLHLEQNWRGPLLANAQIPSTLRELRSLERTLGNHAGWRVKMALYRACYDAYLQQRLRVETHEQASALVALNHSAQTNIPTAIDEANRILNSPLPAETAALRNRVFQLAGELFHDVGLQLSTKLYGAANWERGANLDRVDTSLNDRSWLQKQFSTILALQRDQQRDGLERILDHYQTPAGSFRDDLGFPQKEAHLVRGPAYNDDPEMYRQAIDGVSDHTPEEGWNWAELTYAEALYEQPLQLRYEHLDHKKRYHLRVIYAGEDYAVSIRLTANHSIELQPYTLRQSNPEEIDYDLPAAATESGTLLLEWTRLDGIGGGGRGRQVAEVQLSPNDE